MFPLTWILKPVPSSLCRGQTSLGDIETTKPLEVRNFHLKKNIQVQVFDEEFKNNDKATTVKIQQIFSLKVNLSFINSPKET